MARSKHPAYRLFALSIAVLILFILAGCRAPAWTHAETTIAAQGDTPLQDTALQDTAIQEEIVVQTDADTQSRAMDAEERNDFDDGRWPTLVDFWDGKADFQMETLDTGLPMGESDTRIAPQAAASASGTSPEIMWSYVHASNQSLGVVDQCGDPVEFPGCIVIFESNDAGRSFRPMVHAHSIDGAVTCQIPCRSCPCTSQRDHIDQQQYPRVQHHIDPATQVETWLMAYEYRANVFLRRSTDGLNWSTAEEVPLTGIWQDWLMPCPAHATIGAHPFSAPTYDCLVGSPPGLYIDTDTDNLDSEPEVYVFVGLGQNPGAIGCYRGPLHAPAALYRHCEQNPLFVGVAEYGPLDDTGPATNPYFDFRTISSADVIQLGAEYYMLYEGVRGPEDSAAGDTQFTLALARTTAGQIDGPWETYSGNPILVDMPGNVGVGHADLLIHNGITYLYTTLDGEIRSRLVLTWNDE